MFLLDVSITSHCKANTGVQRVSRRMFAELSKSGQCMPMCFDPYMGHWRHLDSRENNALTPSCKEVYSGGRRAQWTFWQKIRGGIWRVLPTLSDDYVISKNGFEGLIVPEIFEPKNEHRLSVLPRCVTGTRVAIFHDLIAVKHPELTPTKTVRWYPKYLKSLLDYDGIAAVSNTSTKDLLDYWEVSGLSKHPPVRAIPLGVDLAEHGHTQMTKQACREPPTVLMVGTIEARKDHITLLKAAQHLWGEGARFRLRLIGGSNRETAAATLKYLRRLQEAGVPVDWLGSVSDQRLQQEFEQCRFTVYPSLYEGFGLPVLESLSFGKPCICSDADALREHAHGGGCLVVRRNNVNELLTAMIQLLNNEALYHRLVEEAKKRRIRTWQDYCEEIINWTRSLSTRDSR